MPAPTDLLITEYVEGSGVNKALEIWNGTGAAIDLSQYWIVVSFNGGTSTQQVQLSGTLASGDVFVIANAGSSAAILAVTDLQSSAIANFNGDDAITLRKGSATGTVIDSIGQLGTDPGTAWGTAPTSTLDSTLRLKSTIDTGDTVANDAFDPATRFDGFAQNNIDDLGQHTGPTGGGGGGDPVVSVTATDAAATEGSAPAFQFTFTRTGGDQTQALTVDFTYGGSALVADFTAAGGGAAPTSITFAANEATAVLDLVAVDDVVEEDAETVTVTVTDGAAYDVTGGAATATITSDEVAVTLISTVQGSGSASALVGQSVTVQAVVTGDFQNGDADTTRNLGGFFIQEETTDSDGNVSTSEAIFVQNDSFAVSVGDRVRVTGTVNELFNKTSLISVSAVTVLESDVLSDVEATTLTLSSASKESLEGMLITIPERLVISEQFELDRLGEIRLYDSEGDGLAGAVAESADGRAYQFTQINQPTTDGSVAAYVAEIAARSIIYDDGLNGTYQPITNPDGGGLYTTATAPQMGDSIVGLTGVLDFDFSNFRIRSTVDGENDFEDTNPRETAPADVGGSVKVASFNVLNFFVTLDTAGTSTDIGQDPRGADTQDEFDRQVQKLVTTILALDADVIGLIELENDFSLGSNPLADGNAASYLVDQLNLALGPNVGDVWSWVDPGTEFVGSDAISNAFIYRNDVVEIAGGGTAIAIDNDAVHNRPPIAVTFEEIATGGEFTAVVNHFKSKGSGTGVNADQGDGQGASNFDRVAQANALIDFVASNPTGTTDTDYILLGDFNAYFQEDPLDVLRTAGYDTLGGPTSVSYTFDGQLGSLDHIFFNGSLSTQTTGLTKWHVNSDEADALSFELDANDTNVNTNRDPAIFDGATPYYVSDHDPILLGLNLTPTDKVLLGTAQADTLLGKNGFDQLTGLGGRDTLKGGAADDQLSGGADDDRLVGGSGNDVIDGGDGLDYVDYRDETQVVVLTLNGAGDATATVGGGEVDTIRNVERVQGGSAGDVLGGDAGANTLLGNGGNDRLKGGAGLDTLDGGADIDTVDYSDQMAPVRVALNGAATVSVFVGGVREDVIRNVEAVLGGIGDDDLRGDSLGNRLFGDGGFDVLRGMAGDDQLDGSTGDDVVVGGLGNDELFGGEGFDRVSGGDGDDDLEGGTGNDSLTGEAGTDRFIFSRFDGLDTIRDFDAGGVDDVLAFRALSFGLTVGGAAPVEFGAAATGATATFLYNEATRTLSWDSDGAGGVAAERLAVFATATTLQSGDFVLI